MLCYQELVTRIYSRTQSRKRLNFYYKTDGITFLKTHVVVEHTIIAKMFEEEVNFLLKGRKERQLAKKKTIVSNGSISNFVVVKDSFKKKDVPQNYLKKNMGPLIIKSNLPIELVESMWLKRLILHLCAKLNFLSKR
jgi:hypothetical protein